MTTEAAGGVRDRMARIIQLPFRLLPVAVARELQSLPLSEIRLLLLSPLKAQVAAG